MPCPRHASIALRRQKVNGHSEQRAFLRLWPALLRTQRDKYVAIHDGKAVDSGEDEIALGLRVYAKFGYVPICVARVSDEPQPVVRIPTPRLKRTNS